ncbi:MAG: PH domain-containing protein [Nitrososphaera sp.]|jgi:hypothetical protein
MIEKIDPEIADLLTPGEEILLVASQSRNMPGGAVSRIYITNRRVLFKDPKLFGLRAKIIDVSYDDISTVMLRRGMFSTEIYLKPRSSPHKIELPAVDKKVALRASLLIQRGMRGELQGRRVPQPTMPQVQEKAEAGPDPLHRLEKLASMRTHGVLSEQEFNILKEELMMSIKPEVAKERVMPRTHPESIAQPAAQAFEGIEKKPPGTCTYCNFASVPQGAKFCPECGKAVQQPVETAMWKMCPVCDALMADGAAFCAACKQRFPETFS